MAELRQGGGKSLGIIKRPSLFGAECRHRAAGLVVQFSGSKSLILSRRVSIFPCWEDYRAFAAIFDRSLR